ncbi:hypothetical protein [Kitasatospora camelliae]|uniref:Lantibiotic biosynthesis dehydratase-like protein n=1 Tax=Kitasatospora camelliae TaxID=3156397 RepID=A0AAU8K7D0_9ACTN
MPAASGNRPEVDPRDARARDLVAYYRHPAKGPLLREAVLPYAERCAAEGLTVHVERHWLHGPHLRLRIDGPADRCAAAAERGAAELRRWITRHPSVSDLDERALLDRAAEAGRIELIAPPYGPLVPDNTVRIEPVDRAPLRALIGPDGVELRDELLALGLAPLRSGSAFLGEHGDSPTARVQLAVAALAAHAAAHPGGLVGGHYSFVSHLEDFLVHDDADGSLRAAFERRWKSTGPAVTRLVGRIAEGGAVGGAEGGATGALGWERDWAAWSAGAWRLTERRHAAGADLHGFPLEYRVRAAATGDAGAVERWNQDIRTRYSEFHRLLRRSDPDGRMWSRPDYLVYRACTNALYRLFTVCDVRPVERYLAAYLVVRAVPALTGHDWREEIGRVIAAVERLS